MSEQRKPGQTGDDGTRIRIELGVDASTAAVATIKVRKPDFTTETWPATPDGTSIYYDAAASDLDQVGDYIVQAYVDLPGLSWAGHSPKVGFKILDNIF
ncbi:MAG: hypothetical protein C0613_08270 [Desulfobulbaceae bacterium]|nr:MAG: hypothetical protein C0613_08270 [Desulfobulbaceae bacterium]